MGPESLEYAIRAARLLAAIFRVSTPTRMANFVLVLDPDGDRRASFAQAVRRQVAPVDGLRTEECSGGDVHVVWAAAPSAPVSAAVDADGGGVVWGEAIGAPGALRVGAAELRRAWREPGPPPPEPWDGFYAAIAWRRNGPLVTGGDLLGLYPIYYYGTANLLLVGSSPRLFTYHPAFQARLNPVGLVGILLTAGLIDGETLWSGVRRLSPGHLLVWRRGEPPREMRQYQIPVSDRYFGLPFSTHVELLHDRFVEAVARHAVAGQRHGLLLSGGRDSRLLAGCLVRGARECAALTLGLPRDFDAQCARQVARRLGIEHTIQADAVDQYPRFAELQVSWEHLANGMSSLYTWGIHHHLRGLAATVVAAYSFDPILGGSTLLWGHDAATKTASFTRFFARLNRYGIPTELLRRLLRDDAAGQLVDESIERARDTYQALPGLEFQRGLLFYAHHRLRFHAGGTPWRLSFGAWPVLPVLDRGLLEAIGGMPVASLAERRAQDELLRSRFPDLARLPLDRNSSNTEPLSPPLWRRALRTVVKRLGAVPGVPTAVTGPRTERRRYYRLYDINGAGWRAVRREAEPYREGVAHLMREDVLHNVLGSPDTEVSLHDPIVDSSGLKLLLGLLLWSKNYS